jgi:hypothetical protein
MAASPQHRSNDRGARSSLARASLVLALAPCLFVLGWLYEPIGARGWGVTSPFAVVLGHLARRRLRRSAERPAGPWRAATAGLVLGYMGTVWLAFIVVAAIVIAESDLAF